ncbi:acetyl-CoA synthetase-like protein [Fomitiporia mediterranea MF3/22]|uniref:acetyl-CoA synthetase-like protein n=1 Tax=Fomitiporia mediterranea (strain MF3/22) TaxID=694068 RepID=UPI0004409CE4|nr:acetyl-CoA synthetase-like protein [Fomitiporia mediterranea MF3/22]EJC99743.1 acetyl-CoA synthetase-like protein [Fomitiporia mediterranea MF3/22]
MFTMFAVPPVGSLTLPALYEWHYHNSPDHPLFVFKDGSELRTICWKEGIQGMHRASKWVVDSVGNRASKQRPVIGVLTSSDTLTYFCFIVGVMRLGWAVFPMSPRNSPPVIASLLRQVNATHVFMSKDEVIQNVVDASLGQLPKDHQVETREMPSFHDLFPQRGPDTQFVFNAMQELDMQLPALILHSSGTTSLPKAVIWSQWALAKGASVPMQGDLSLTGMVVAIHVIPMFHAMGAIQLMGAPSRGVVMSMFTPQCPAIVPDPGNVLSTALETKSDFILCVPTFLEIWARDPRIVDELVKLKGLIWGGATLAKSAGDLLISKGVKLHIVYGSTEAGLLSRYLSNLPGKEWEYFCFTPNRDVRFFPDSEGICEAIAVSNSEYMPCIVNTTFEGRDAYILSDLFVRHPTKDYLWKVLGRTDDQIVLSTGEKANPIPLEAVLATDPHIQASIFVGQGRFHLGVIVEPKPAYQFDPSNTDKLAEFRTLIWPSIERANEIAPSYARIYKEMVLVTSPGKPFTYTVKGIVRRQEATTNYKEEIDAMYRAAEESSQAEIGAPNDWAFKSVLEFVRRVVNATLKQPIADDIDMFTHGCDSLNATWIRNSLLRVLRKEHSQIARDLPTNFVYTHPSITSLAKFVTEIVSSGFSGDSSASNLEGHEERLQQIVDKYTGDLPPNSVADTDSASQGKDTVVLTGSTGAFGCIILARLLASNDIEHVYALGRKPSAQGGEPSSLLRRHVRAFQAAGLDTNLLKSEKLSFLESNLTASDFEIDASLLQTIRSSVTHIIHGAWTVDFNLSLESFEPHFIGLRNLVNLALSCSGQSRRVPRLVFISSVGSVRSAPSPVREHFFASPSFALGSGYTESKWTAERILEIVSERTRLQSIVVRFGQLTGGPSGAWKEDEWFPGLVKSSIALGCLPDSNGSVSWITSSDAAATLLELRKADTSRVFHVAHPHPIKWSKLVSDLSRILKVPVVPYTTWLGKLEEAHQRLFSGTGGPEMVRDLLRENPALRIIDVFRGYASQVDDPTREPLGTPLLSCDAAMSVASALQSTANSQLGQTDVEKWLSYWSSTGFLRSRNA